MMGQFKNETLDAFPCGIIRWNKNYSIVYANTTARTLLKSKSESNPLSLSDIPWINQFGEPLSIEKHPVIQCFKNGEVIPGTILGLPLGNRIVWIETHCIPEFEGGDPMPVSVCFSFSKTLLSDNKYTLNDEQNKLNFDRLFFESDILNRIGQSIIVTNLEGTILYVNHVACKNFGYTREEFLQKNIVDTTVPDASQVLANGIMKKLSEGESWSGEFEVKRKDGTIFTASVTDSPFYDERGNLAGIIGISTDITEYKKIENVLQESEHRFVTLFRSNPTPSGITLASDFRIVDVNDAWCKLTGYKREEAIGYTSVELGLAKPETLDRVRNIIQDRNAFPQSVIQLFTRNGEERHVLINSELIETGREKFFLNNLLDITENEQAGEQLNKLAERLNLATQSAEIGIWDWDIQNNELVWDEQMVALYGLKPGDFKGAYEAWLNGVHPDDREESNYVTQSALRGEREFHTEFRVLWPDGSVHWLKADGKVFRDEKGTAVRMVGINYDITERKLAEKNLTLWADIFENVTFGFVIGEPNNMNLRLMNPAFARMHGYAPEELIGMPILEVFAPESRGELAKQIKIAHEKGHHSWESLHIRKDGSIFPVLVDAIAVKDQDGKILYRIVTVQDITERKLAEQKLRESEKRYTTLFRESNIPVVLMKLPEVCIADANKATEELTGFSREELIGKNSAELGILSHSQRDDSILQFEGKGLISHNIIHITNKNGDERIINVNTNPVEINGEPFAFTSIHDITERVIAENKLRESEQKLKLFIEYAPAAIAMFDTNMKYIAASKRYLLDYGIKETSIIGRSHYEIFPEIGEEWKQIHRRCMDGATEIREKDKFLRADGSIDWLHWEIHPWYQDREKIGGIILLTELITERINAKIDLENS